MIQPSNKTWGVEFLWANTQLYSSKLIIIKEGLSTEKSYNKKQNKTIFILQGIVQLTVEGSKKILNEGETYTFLPKIVHQLTAIKGDVTIIEAGTSFDSSDVVTIEV